ncbi:MAG: hypothetical protein GYB53_08455 [Rhodobacteraceae bacterium]|nr:hypothetical protein [Paracoccaceae bacterium]MBR9822617.1 hypothetical protein [Paracoccaceae bacterium]
MKKKLGRAVKFRDHILKNLDDDFCPLTWNGDRTFSDDVAQRILDSFPFYIEPTGVKFLEEHALQLNEEEFYRAIAEMRLPFPEVWLELDSPAPKGYPDGKAGAIIDYTDDGLRVFTAKLIKLPEGGHFTVLYAGSEVLFKRDGNVQLTDTPGSFLDDAISERRKGRIRTAETVNAPIPIDTVREREREALQDAIRSVAKLLSISALHNRPDVLAAPTPSLTSKGAAKKFVQGGAKVPARELTLVTLGKAGRVQTTASTSGSRRQAHWVRGHLFLARNGKLTWRRPHVRGEGSPQKTPRSVGAMLN